MHVFNSVYFAPFLMWGGYSEGDPKLYYEILQNIARRTYSKLMSNNLELCQHALSNKPENESETDF